MRTGAASGHVGNFHEAGFYRSDAESRALIMPFIEGGLAAGEPVVCGYDTRKVRLIRSWLHDPSAVTFLVDKSLYATPAAAIENYRQLFEMHVAGGATQIRIAGDVPHAGNGGDFHGWDRYESAVNAVWEDYPVWSRCLYDAATVPDDVRDVVERTHPRLVTPSRGTTASERYQDGSSFQALTPEPDLLESTPPFVHLIDPSPAQARQRLVEIASGRIAPATLEDLLIGLSEAIGNADQHGCPPTTVTIWADPHRVAIHIHDHGPGPADPLAGLVPVADPAAGSGLGLWLTHQLDIDVAHIRSSDGFTIRLRSSAPSTEWLHPAPFPRDTVTPAHAATPRPPVRATCTVRPHADGWHTTLTMTWIPAEPDMVEIVVATTPPHPVLPAGRWLVPRHLLVPGGQADQTLIEPEQNGDLLKLHLNGPAATFSVPSAWLRAFLNNAAG
jgi:anti-sigma regulatory factor (Ser/Thr protein kinase)